MATPKQTAANRSNARRSTGPRSDDGKARAALNHFKHGLYAKSPIAPGEDPAQRQALQEAYTTRFNPQTIDQLYLVDVLVQLHWEDLRLTKVDAHLWTSGVTNVYKPEPDTVLGRAFMNHKETFNVLGRRRDANHRKYIVTLRELESLQSVPLPGELDDAEPSLADPAPPAVPEPEAPAAAPPAEPEPAPQTVESETETPKMASNPRTPANPAPSPIRQGNTFPHHPNPGHPPIDECPNCSVLGYPSPSCRYQKPKAS